MATIRTAPASTDEEAVLSARSLSKHFRLHRGRRRFLHAVDDVDIDLFKGRVVALVGESGSGKSTVARLLAQLHPATSGEIRLHGEPIAVKGGRKLRAYVKRVQLILQDPFASLNPVHRVRYVLTRSLKIHHPGIGGGELERSLAELLEKVHLQPNRHLDKFPYELSGGQRQRVSIARALGADPEVLLADEPVSMLDVSIRLGVLNLLTELTNDLDLAVLYITHDIASARYFADETAVMYAGRIVERGDSETVTQDPAHPYTRLLIASSPDPDALGHHDATTDAKGDPPSLINPPPGCRFATRCPRVMPRCTTESPPTFTTPQSGRSVACWLYGEADQ